DGQFAGLAEIVDGAQLYGRVQAAALTIAPYSLTDLVMEVTASDGAVQVPRLDFGLNGGTAHHTLTMDLTGPEPAVATTIDWRGLGADENLRPFFDLVFPNLFMTGTLDFSAQYQGTWADATRLTETLEGTSTMVVNGGYLVSDPTPESTREVFPTLTLSHYAFRRAHIETRTAAGISHNDMRFEAPTINLVMRGTTDNGTREINYVMVVDLVENLGLGGLREAISNKLQSASQVEIAYVTGTLDDQRIEFLRPKVVKIKEIMKSLVSLKPIRKFFMEMSAEEKGAYLTGKVGSVLGAALQPFRFLQQSLNP
ncbi:MAG: AsmA-like C-terminal region-containing protein, partial [Nitrospinota bacterium]